MSRPNLDSEAVNAVFNRLITINNTSKPEDDINLMFLKELRLQALSAAAEEDKIIRKPSTDFTLDEAVQTFGLTYSCVLEESTKYQWRIELSGFETVQPSECLMSLLVNHSRTYNRSSKSARKINVDLLLCECIALLRGKFSATPTQPTEDHDGRRTPTSWDTVKVHCDVSFNHTINRMPTTSKKTVVGGRVDHGVGIILRSKKFPYRFFFHSLLLCVEAKFHGRLVNAFAQLVVYLACLRQSRVNQGRSDSSVYGVATDGFSYIFTTITHDGVLKQSPLFDIMEGHLSSVLGCFKYILEITMSSSTTEKGTLNASEELEDDLIDVDDSPYDDEE